MDARRPDGIQCPESQWLDLVRLLCQQRTRLLGLLVESEVLKARSINSNCFLVRVNILPKICQFFFRLQIK